MIRSTSPNDAIARAVFAEISARFPRLQIIEDLDAPTEISLRLPVQDSLKHQVWLALQNGDEVHFSVGHLWFEYFPCTDPAKVQRYIDAVCGFLSGTYRSLEHYRGTECFKAQLQQPTPGGWETIATWSQLRLPSFRKVTYKEVINA